MRRKNSSGSSVRGLRTFFMPLGAPDLAVGELRSPLVEKRAALGSVHTTVRMGCLGRYLRSRTGQVGACGLD